MLSRAERIKQYGSEQAVIDADRAAAEDVDGWPPLTAAQQDVIRAMFAPAPAEAAPQATPRRAAA